MYPVIHECPVCKKELEVTKLHCRNCDTGVEGHFSLGRLYYLSPEQLAFVETFLRCEGKIKWVEKEMSMSYPAVRARLRDVIRAMGYEVETPDEQGISEEMRAQVLSELGTGSINAEQALELLRGDS